MATRFHALIEERSPLVFAQFEAVPDISRPGFYGNVLIIQKGPAKGHFAVKDGGRVVNYDPEDPSHAELPKYQIVIGDATLDDVARCGAEAQSTKCKLDHGATVRDIVGNYSTFRREGDQVRADLTLMKSTPHREYVEELFSDFAKKVGNSIDFDYRYEIQGDVAVARCVKLNSVDIVDAPAATNSLFHEPIIPPTTMPLSKEDLDAITGVVNSAVESRFTVLQTGIDTRLGKIETTVTKLQEGDDDEDEEKKKKKKEDDDAKTAMSAGVIEKAVLSAVQKVLPKATLDNLASLAASTGGVKDEYAEKVALCEAAGMKPSTITRYIASKWPAVYTSKFGNGGGQKGSAKTTL